MDFLEKDGNSRLLPRKSNFDRLGKLVESVHMLTISATCTTNLQLLSPII